MDYDGFLLCSEKINSYVFFTGACAIRSVGSDITQLYKLRYDLSGILNCLLPYFLRERTQRFRKYFGMPEEKNVILSKAELTDYEGNYECQEHAGLEMKFVVKEGRLMFMPAWTDQEIQIQPITEVDFVAIDFPIPVKFTKDENGKIKTALVSNYYLFQKIITGESAL